MNTYRLRKILRFKNNSFITKALRKAIMYRSKFKNVYRKSRMKKFSSVTLDALDQDWKVAGLIPFAVLISDIPNTAKELFLSGR